MIQVRKTLYLNSENTTLTQEQEAILVKIYHKNTESYFIQKLPPTMIEQIVVFGDTSISTRFVKFCVDHSITLSFVSYYGVYYGRTVGKTNGNILLRKRQYDLFNNHEKRLTVVKNVLLGKGLNQISVLKYFAHDTNSELSCKILKQIPLIQEQLQNLQLATSIEECRGFEGVTASIYFTGLDYAIHPIDQSMRFDQRSKRPPLNYCNAVLSFLYTMLNLTCISALETYGLDSYLGYLHEMRPGRESLANDLMEEMRAPLVDRFVATLINRKQLQGSDFEVNNDGIRLKDQSRKKLLELWEAEKQREILHPLLETMVPIKTLPYIQAQEMAQYIRGDISAYPPFYWGWK